MPSGLGVLLGCICFRAANTSSFVKIATRDWFILLVTWLEREFKKGHFQIGLSIVKSFWKYLRINLSWSLPIFQSPPLPLNFLIWLVLFLCVALLWKKQVFLFTLDNQVILEHCLNNFSFISNYNCISFCASLCSTRLRPRGSVCCRVSSFVCTKQRFYLIELKDFLFQTSNSELHFDICCIPSLNPIDAESEFHAFKIILWHSFESVHIAFNWKIFFLSPSSLIWACE